MGPRLHRSSTDRWVGGVCAGMAATLGVDPGLVRLVWIVAGLAVFPLVPIVYVVLWAALPEGHTTPAVRIAEERYARGEIDADELHRIRQDLGVS